MSVSDELEVTRDSSAGDQANREIRLVDATSPSGSNTEQASPTTEQTPARPSRDSSGDRRWSKGGLREELTRRKYARYQQGRYDEGDAEGENGEDAGPASDAAPSTLAGKALDRGRARTARLRDKLRKKKAAPPTKDEAAIDILYENQRGLFMCGLPYYSSQSLLNFDPAAWTTGPDYRESPVDITNAQVPDPTWAWAWSSWYVDMSADVDEEGWAYSFSFRQGCAWHGTHPWFHSWVRRRRWLRKRVKSHAAAQRLLPDSMTEAHRLNQDYFTIHAGRRDTSRGSSADRGDKRSSFLSGSRAVVSNDSEEEEDISDVVALIKVMKATTVDRKKLDALENFLEHGGNEILYLPDMIEEVISMFMYQSSRRQLLHSLQQAAGAPPKSPGKSPSGKGTRFSAQRAEGLQKAIDAVRESVAHLEYWSDMKSAEQDETGAESTTEPVREKPFESNDKPSIDPLKTKDINEEISNVRIRGIPSSAELDVEPGIMRPLGYMQEGEGDGGMSSAREKGKQKA